MTRMTRLLAFALLVSLAGCGIEDQRADPVTHGSHDHLLNARESHLANLRQLTFGGQNAEAYFSNDGRQLIYQATTGDLECDQIFRMNVDGSGRQMVSSGKGATTCAYFLPGDDRVLYASTHLGNEACPPKPDRSQGYVWPIYDSYDIFTAHADGSDLERLTTTPGYDAEATVSPDGERIVFTSMRDGDLDLYAMDVDGSNVERLTDTPGYDGGAFFSPDSSRIVWRAHHPTDADAIRDYRDLLSRKLVRPSQMELFIMDADGTHKRRLTNNGAANFCPFFTPDGEHVVFSSNLDPNGGTRGREFDLFMVDLNGPDGDGRPVQITFTPEFDGFPMFSPDGRKLVFASNRGGSVPGETNVFIAVWAP